MYKKIAATVIAALMLAGTVFSVAGCGEKKPDDGTPGGTTAEEIDAAAQAVRQLAE